MKYLILIAALVTVGCGSSSTGPTPAPVTPTPNPTPIPTPPPPISMISVSACPDAVQGLEIGFYRELGCGTFDLSGSVQPVRRWNVAPKLYIRTVDEAGAAIDAVTLDTVQNAMTSTAAMWTGGKFSLGIERGADTRQGQSGWITVRWPVVAPAGFCASSTIAQDGGTIDLYYLVGGGCSCGAAKIRPLTARHELGHAFGYWHTDNQSDLMSAKSIQGCDQQPSARELQAAAYHYR